MLSTLESQSWSHNLVVVHTIMAHAPVVGGWKSTLTSNLNQM
jgi:hypothetical protein